MSLGGKGDLKVEIKNGHEYPVELNTEIVLPDELSCSKPKRQLTLSSGSQQATKFSISNFSALEGSTYRVPILIRYKYGDVDYCRILPATIKITGKRTQTLLGQKWLAIGLVILISAIIIGLQFKSKIKARFIKTLDRP